jgi:hypothetical protein
MTMRRHHVAQPGRHSAGRGGPGRGGAPQPARSGLALEMGAHAGSRVPPRRSSSREPWARALAVGAGLIAAAALWPPARQQLIARAWCIITPHRVRTGCAEAWIHSRRGKLPMVLLTTQQPFGERVHLWCRAGTSALDFESARPTLISACWARDIQVTVSLRHAPRDPRRDPPPSARGPDFGGPGAYGERASGVR